MTTTHDIPDDIRNALKIREDLDGLSGELLGYEGLAFRRAVLFLLPFLLVAGVGGISAWLLGHQSVLAGIGGGLVGCLPGTLFMGFWLRSTQTEKRVSWSFALGHTQCVLRNYRFAYTEVQHISFAYHGMIGTRIRIRLDRKRAPVEVMLDARIMREAEWLVEQIQARMAAAQSGTVPEELTRLTKQAGDAESSTRPANASATTQTT